MSNRREPVLVRGPASSGVINQDCELANFSLYFNKLYSVIMGDIFLKSCVWTIFPL